MANSFTPLRTTPDGWTLTRDGWEPPEPVRERDPFAPPTNCPVCFGRAAHSPCRVCQGTGEFIRTGIFVGHSCSRCRDGALPDRCPTKVRGNCGEPFARND